MITPTLTVATCSNMGQKRSSNEDAILASCPVFIVADGMGGHDGGARASSIAVEVMSQLTSVPRVEDVRDALTRARLEINELQVGDTKRAAGTTVSGLVLVEQAQCPYWLILNLGDSRTYRLTRSGITQISVDHSEVQELIDSGNWDDVVASQYQRRHVITRVLGAHTVECPDYWLIPVQGPERWMVCSDGLTQELDDERISQILSRETSAQDAADALVESALAAGGRDNISVVVVDVHDTDMTLDEVTIDDVGAWVDTLEEEHS